MFSVRKARIIRSKLAAIFTEVGAGLPEDNTLRKYEIMSADQKCKVNHVRLDVQAPSQRMRLESQQAVSKQIVADLSIGSKTMRGSIIKTL